MEPMEPTTNEEMLHRAMRTRDTSIGALGGLGVAGALMARKPPKSPLDFISIAGPMALSGGMLGSMVGKERAQRDVVKHERHVGDMQRAQDYRKQIQDVQQEHRKELLNMRKQATLDGVMLAAMADELQHIHQEKVAIGLPQIGQVGNMLGSLGSKALTGVTSMAAKHAPQMAQGMNAGLLRAGQAVGGGANLSKLVGGGLVGAGALGAAGAARGLMGGQR